MLGVPWRKQRWTSLDRRGGVNGELEIGHEEDEIGS